LKQSHTPEYSNVLNGEEEEEIYIGLKKQEIIKKNIDEEFFDEVDSEDLSMNAQKALENISIPPVNTPLSLSRSITPNNNRKKVGKEKNCTKQKGLVMNDNGSCMIM
jgi:hypothetical protein